MHHRCAHLHAGGAQGQKLGRIAPVGDTTDGGDGDGDPGITGQGPHHVQCDGLHGRSAIAALRALGPYGGHGNQGVEVHTDDRFDSVDQREAVSAACHGSFTGNQDVTDIGRELHQDRHLGILLDPGGNFRQNSRLLAYGAAHAALAHTVGAAEIQLQAVGPGVFRALDDIPPLLLGLHHQ